MFEVNGKKFTQDEDGFIHAVSDYSIERDNKQALKQAFDKEHSETEVRLERMSIKGLMTHSVDTILDTYNDYMALFNLFGDTIYQARAKFIYRLLKAQFEPEGGETI